MPTTARMPTALQDYGCTNSAARQVLHPRMVRVLLRRPPAIDRKIAARDLLPSLAAQE